MRRFYTLVFLAAAIVAAGVLSAVATARAGASDASGTTTFTTSTAPTAPTTTTSTTPNPVPVVSKFPAAGQLNPNSVIVRTEPSPSAKKIKTFHYFRSDYRVQEILAIGSRTGSDGQPWYHVSVPMRPNGTYGWIPAAAAELKPTQSEIVVNVSRRTIDVYRRGKHVVHAIVAVGAPGMETPLGHFYVAATFVPYHDPFLGVYALETSAYSKLTEWPGGGVVGIHGTSAPWLLGKAVSHGCVRVSNATAAKLKRYTPLGTPIVIKS